MKNFTLIVLFLFATLFQITAQDNLTYIDLINRLYDLEYLATPPMEGEQSGSFSSFDRRARYDVQTNMYKDWDANADGTGYIRMEADSSSIVVFEKDGPGVIWRVWSALALDGHIKIYVDHEQEPIIDQAFDDFFEQINEDGIELPKSLPGYPSVNLPNLTPTLSRGRNRWIPIPYQKHCKIVFEKGWGMYYHITYTTFPEEVGVAEFDGIHRKADCIALAEADRILANRGHARKQYANETVEQKKIKLSRNKSKAITIEGNCAITHFNLTYDKNNYENEANRREFLQNVWLKITWDDETKAAVNVPLGLFFGTYPDAYPNRTIPIGALPGYLYSNWYMPFSKQAKLEIINKGARKHEIEVEIAHIPLRQSAAELLRFHSKWHDGKFKEEVQSKGREKDWPLLVTEGRGRFCGVTLHIQNEWEEPEKETVNWWYGKYGARNIWWWWGEGDEKFYVDGENFPSTFGTGSEDYIGYAWSAEPAFALFDSGFASQPFTAIDGNGHTIVSRFHISDNIPFQKSFTAVIDKYKADKWGDKEQNCTVCTNICLYQAVAFWYLMPNQTDNY